MLYDTIVIGAVRRAVQHQGGYVELGQVVAEVGEPGRGCRRSESGARLASSACLRGYRTGETARWSRVAFISNLAQSPHQDWGPGP
jgi:hypothetical protein